MTANTAPRFTAVPKNGFCKVSGVDSSTDGTDADVVLLFTANATDGSKVGTITFTPRSTSGSTSTSQACARIYLNNGSSVGTGTNNCLIAEKSLVAGTVNTAAIVAADGATAITLNMELQAGYCLYVGITAMAANTNWDVMVEAGDFS